MNRPAPRSRWHRVNGRWVCSLGHRGTTVRLFENRNGVYYRDVWHEGRKDRRSLRTRDKAVAERKGKELLAHLLLDGPTYPKTVLTLSRLWEKYSHESQDFLDNSATSRRGDEWSFEALAAYFGPDFGVSRLTPNDQTAFTNARMQGGIQLANGKVTRPVRARTVQSDLNLLHQMLRWASKTIGGDGQRLLQLNPLDGARIIREANDLRPVATIERFTRTREAIAKRLSATTDEAAKHRLVKIDLALVVAEATGRRLGSIRCLRWEDIDLARNQITWRAEFDKKRKESVVPIPPTLAESLRQARVQLAAISGFVFAAEQDPTKPMDRHLFDHWLAEAEKWAGLPKLRGGLWHPYRRKWATERKNHPIRDVMAAGGWSDAETLLKCYQHPDRDTLLRVMNEPNKLSEAV